MQTANDLLKKVVDSLNHLPDTKIRHGAKHKSTYEICSDIDKYLKGDKLMSYSETLTEISICVGFQYGNIRKVIHDSMEINALCIKWAEEFEKLHKDTDWDETDWIDTVESWAVLKIHELTGKKI